MYVTLNASTRCWLCGYLHPVIRSSSVRVNKNSLKETSTPIVMAGYRTCPECGEPNLGQLVPVSRYRLRAEDEAKVNAYRERKGWA